MLKGIWNNLVKRKAGTGLRPAASVDDDLKTAISLHRAGDLESAKAIYGDILAAHPTHPDALHLLGYLAHQQNFHDKGIALMTRAIALNSGAPEYHVNCGLALFARGETMRAIQCYVRALELQPVDPEAHAKLLFALAYGEGLNPSDILAEHRRWQKRNANFGLQQHANSPDPSRRLSIGYVSADFRDHVIALFVEPFLSRHDHTRFEIFCYDNAPVRDEVTSRLKTCVDCWREIDRLDDDGVATLIRGDGIDVLVDLAGHTGGGRMGVFARKPAPVQISYLGYPMSTGLDCMDYRISDWICDPPGLTELHYTEAILRLPHSLWCYEPPPDIPDVSELPALTRGFVTFGSFNHPAKIADQVIALWSAVLAAIGDAKLLLAPVPPGEARERLCGIFARHGIAVERLEFETRLATRDYQALRQRVDIALDPFPCNGASTTCETLWMGVPLVTLEGDRFVSRAGASLLTAVGLQQCVAKSAAEYVAIARRLATDRGQLVEIRATLRERMRASPLHDGAGLARNLEALYVHAWRQWCVRQVPASP
jgi:predicted O-linked N-acetylglucosamine transferase (SPINDLY family)